MSKKFGKILAVDDNADILFALKLLLKKQVETVVIEENPKKIPALLEKENFDLILLDMNFTKDAISGKEGFHWLEKIKEIDPSIIVIFITAYGDVENAVDAFDGDAVDAPVRHFREDSLFHDVGFELPQGQGEAL